MNLKDIYTAIEEKLNTLLYDAIEDKSDELTNNLKNATINRYKCQDGVYIYIFKYNDSKCGKDIIITSNPFEKPVDCICPFGFNTQHIKGSYIRYRVKRESYRDIIWLGVPTSENRVSEFKIIKPMNLSQKYEIDRFDLKGSIIDNDPVGTIISKITNLKELDLLVVKSEVANTRN